MLDDEEQAKLLRLIAQQTPAAPAAFRKLYEHYRRPVISYYVHRRMAPTQAEDLFQDTFTKVATRAGQYAGGSAPGWIWAIARRCLFDHINAQQGEPPPVDYPGEPSDDPWGRGRESDDVAAQAVDDCVQKQLQIFERDHPEQGWALWLAHVYEWPMERLAQHLGRTNGATRQFLSQCRKKFAAYLLPCRELLKP